MSYFGATMELNQLQTILENHSINPQLTQSIMAEAKAVTMNTTGVLGTILDAPIELAESQLFEDGGQATPCVFPEDTSVQETPVAEQMVTMPSQIGSMTIWANLVKAAWVLCAWCETASSIGVWR